MRADSTRAILVFVLYFVSRPTTMDQIDVTR